MAAAAAAAHLLASAHLASAGLAARRRVLHSGADGHVHRTAQPHHGVQRRVAGLREVRQLMRAQQRVEAVELPPRHHRLDLVAV